MVMGRSDRCGDGRGGVFCNGVMTGESRRERYKAPKYLVRPSHRHQRTLQP